MLAALPAGTLPESSGVLSLVLLSLGMPAALSLVGLRLPLVLTLVARVTLLLASAPSALKLPAASENLVLATLMVALLPVAAGVKMAVQTLGSVALCWKLPSVPPVTATSTALKSATGSDSVKVTAAVWPLTSALVSATTANVGGTVSMVKGVSGTAGLGVLLPAGVTISCGV